VNAAAIRRLWAIVPAAGRGERFASSETHNLPKQYTPLLGSSVLEWSLRALLAEPRIHAIVVVLAAGDSHWQHVAAKLNSPKLLTTIGGAQRQDSVMNGLELLASRAAADDWILVHDAARPCLSGSDIGALVDALQDTSGDGASIKEAAVNIDGAVLAAPIVDTIRRQLPSGVETVDRTGLWRALTPQVFAFAPLRRALQDAARAGVAVTDEAQAMERIGIHASLISGSPFNIKVTRAEDLSVAAGILRMAAGELTMGAGELKMGESTQMRVGQGMDVHAFGEGDHVVLGGVRIAHGQGVVAHSDGDVVIHALCDALLGAMGDGDIGQHFPDTDPRYRGADSRVFLRVVAQRMKAAGLRLVNADITVLAEAPRIAVHRSAMAANLAADLDAAAAVINIKATTTERLGFIGRKEGLAALASVLLAGA
jgi:2-C-methyl-D-erythritol 4-phosphate cytidylyltransferase/2-C-methyl-D-erythritol 2,4-cyclodiphosphate synthase